MFQILFSDSAVNSASIITKTVKFHPQIFEILLFENCLCVTTCSFSHAKHRRILDFGIPMNL